MRAPTPRHFLVAGTLALALAGALLPVSAFGLVPFAPFVVGPLAAWWALTSGGLLMFYLPAFAKREPPAALAWALLAAAALAVALPFAGASWGLLASVWGALGLATALAGARIGARVPLHRGTHPYVAADRVAAAAALAAFTLAALGGVGLAAFALGPSAGLATPTLVLGPPALLGVAGFAHVLPRAAKDPRLARGAGAAAALLAAAAVVASTPVYPFAVTLELAGAGILVLVVVRALARRPAGEQARAAAPFLLAGAAFLLVGPATAMSLGYGASVPALLAPQALGGGLLLAGLTYALAPVAVNQVPASRRACPWIAAAAALGGAGLVASLSVAPGLRVAGAGLLAAAALAHVANLAPMWRPRRECPLPWRIDDGTDE